MSKNYDISKSGAREAEGRPSEASLIFFESWLIFKTRFEVRMEKKLVFFADCALVMVAKIQKLAYCC